MVPSSMRLFETSTFPVHIKSGSKVVQFSPRFMQIRNSTSWYFRLYDGDRLYEVKGDGFRTLTYKTQANVDLCSRNNKSFNEKFYPLYESLRDLPADMVADGEIVVLNSRGLPYFATLQSWRSEADEKLAYFVFDLLWYEGRNLIGIFFPPYMVKPLISGRP